MAIRFDLNAEQGRVYIARATIARIARKRATSCAKLDLAGRVTDSSPRGVAQP
jgi:hypothetical protein